MQTWLIEKQYLRQELRSFSLSWLVLGKKEKKKNEAKTLFKKKFQIYPKEVILVWIKQNPDRQKIIKN